LTCWSAIIYLKPNPPSDGGTILFRHKESGISYTHGDSKLEEMLNKDSRNIDAWHAVDTIGNNYNRCVLFRGKQSHMSNKYFGTSLENARLFQTFFFDD
jgi:hypothetical protein